MDINTGKLHKFAFVFFALIFAAGAALAQPANDHIANAELLSGNRVQLVRDNVAATKEPGEANHAQNPGGRSVWFRWVAPMDRMYTISTARTPANLDTLVAVYRGTDPAALTLVRQNDNVLNGSNLRSFTRFEATKGQTYYIAVDGKSENGQPVAEGTFTLELALSQHFQGSDYDADGKTDLAIFRPSTGTWWIKRSTTGAETALQWGTEGDIPLASAYEGNGHGAYTVYRPSSGYWYSKSGCCAMGIQQFGLPGDIPVLTNLGGGYLPGSIGTFRPSEGTWYLYDYQGGYNAVPFGLQGDIPVPAMYQGDDFIADLAVFRPSTGTWWILSRPSFQTHTWTHYAVQFGMQGDKPVQADYDGDGLVDLAVYRPSSGVWWILRSSDGQVNAFQWGIAEDVPATGDYDADGKADIAVWRPSSGTWYVLRSSDFSAQITKFGLPGDTPITANRAY